MILPNITYKKTKAQKNSYDLPKAPWKLNPKTDYKIIAHPILSQCQT